MVLITNADTLIVDDVIRIDSSFQTRDGEGVGVVDEGFLQTEFLVGVEQAAVEGEREAVTNLWWFAAVIRIHQMDKICLLA